MIKIILLSFLISSTNCWTWARCTFGIDDDENCQWSSWHSLGCYGSCGLRKFTRFKEKKAKCDGDCSGNSYKFERCSSNCEQFYDNCKCRSGWYGYCCSNGKTVSLNIIRFDFSYMKLIYISFLR